MKTFALPLLLALSPMAMAAEPASEVAPTAPADETVLISAAESGDSAAEASCVRDTGTRVQRDDDTVCNGLPGESYDREEIERTGAIDTADAIRRLSPSATIRR